MRLLLVLGLCLLSFHSFSQEKCAFVEHNKHLLQEDKIPGHDNSFEQWMLEKKKALIAQKTAIGKPFAGMRVASATGVAKYVIPVVVHVIHHGEALGQGANIPKEQILSQIQTLNTDFRALNTAEINNLPAAFKSLAADTEIEFVLAKQDPDGVETDGIVRVANTKVSWDQPDDLKLKALSHWPADKYLNFYTAAISYPVLGWAQFPQSSQLEGLNLGDMSEESDGVVIDYRYVGTGYQAVSGSRGRTATHEIGHYFGLRHIWGDSDCSVDDYVQDTPSVGAQNEGCPVDKKPQSCDATDAMYQNYMDYTNDDCMALFTIGQKQRMEVVLQNSPRRKNLPTSIGSQQPIIVSNDASIRKLQLQPTAICNGTYTTSLEIGNYGDNQVTAVNVRLSLDNQLIKSYELAVNLAYLQTTIIKLEDVSIPQPGLRTVSASITLTNNTTDGKSSNNSASTNLYVPLKTTLPLSQDFQQSVSPFYAINPDESFGWERTSAPNGTTASNMAMLMNYYEYADVNQRDILASPIIDLSNEKNFFVSMRAAYGPYDRSSNDGLEIYVSTNCRSSLESATQVFRVSGEALATAPPSTKAFIPTDASQWKSIGLDLSDYAGQGQVQLLIVGVNDYGNNLYLDDILFSNTPLAPLNISLSEILEPSPVFGVNTTPLQVRIKNSGSTTIESLRFRIMLNDEQINDIPVQSLGLQPQASKDISLGSLNALLEGTSKLTIQVYAPNDGEDGMDFDNTLHRQLVVNKSQNVIPMRERFDPDSFTDALWVSTNPESATQAWISQQVMGPNGEGAGENFAAATKFKDNWIQQHWMASPMLKIQKTNKAGMQFWYYAAGSGELNLKVLASTDGGLSWPTVLWNMRSDELLPPGPTNPLQPAEASQWNKVYLNLSSLIGHDQVRIALVASGKNASMIYIDEIEFFLDQINHVRIYPNPTAAEYNLLFNLENAEGEDVMVEIFNNRGALISRKVYPKTSNQIYTEELQGIAAGIYYLRIRSASINTTRKLVLTR